jgi:lipoyl(octanoyl) transferase
MIQYLYLGRVAYDEGLRLQAELVDLRHQGLIENTLLLLEHPAVLTLGRNAHRSNVLASDELLAARGVTIHDIDRGGDVTYHGPGQLVGYPIFDLRSLHNPTTGARLGPVDFVRLMEEALIRVCGIYGVPAGRIKGLTGVWCPPCRKPSDQNGANQATPDAKVAAIGIHVSRGITSHGFAFNITTDLRDFSLIIPCGIADHPVTSLQKEILARTNGKSVQIPALEAVADQAARQFGQVFHQQILAVENLAALRRQAESRAENQSEPVFPADDTPLQVPSEVRHLADPKAPAIRA